MKLKRSLLATPAILALALAGCAAGGSGESTTTSEAGTTAESSEATTGIVSVNGTEPENPLIPANTNEVGGGRIMDMIFAGLYYYDNEGAAQKEMAESVESDDFKTWTVKIKQGWKFTDGTEVKAKNFVDAWKKSVSEAMQNAYFFEPIVGYADEQGADLTGVKTVDDYTFTVELNQPEANFPERLGYTAFFPLPDSTLADLEKGGQEPVSNGPYKLEKPEDWEHNVQIKLVPNPDYQGDRKPMNGGLLIKFMESLDAGYTAVQSGELDVLDQVPASALATYTTEFPETHADQASAVFQSFTIPQNLPHFSGEEGQLRRQAISYAINRDEITEKIFNKTRIPAKDFTSPVVDGFNEKIAGNEVLSYDPEKAKELWAKADEISKWDGTFKIAYNSDGGHQEWVDAVMNGLKNTLGIDAQGDPYPDFKSLRQKVNQRTITTAFRSGWQADYPSMYNFLAPLYATGAGSNDGDYTNPDFDAKLKEAAGTEDVSAQHEALYKSQEILFKDLPAIPLWYSKVSGVWSDAVSDVVFQWNSVPAYYEIKKAE